MIIISSSSSITTITVPCRAAPHRAPAVAASYTIIHYYNSYNTIYLQLYYNYITILQLLLL